MSAGFLLALFAATQSVSLDDVESQSRISVLPSEAHAGLRLTSSGGIQGTEATSTNWANVLGTWLILGAAADYEVQFTKNSGADPTTGVLTTWQALDTTRALTMVRTSIGSSIGNFTVKIRVAATGAVMAEASFSLSATISG